MGTSCVLDIVLIPLHLLPNEITSSQYFTGDDSDDETENWFGQRKKDQDLNAVYQEATWVDPFFPLY